MTLGQHICIQSRDSVDRKDRFQRYERIVEWAKRRYARGGFYVLWRSGRLPSRLTRIENAAAVKLLGCRSLF